MEFRIHFYSGSISSSDHCVIDLSCAQCTILQKTKSISNRLAQTMVNFDMHGNGPDLYLDIRGDYIFCSRGSLSDRHFDIGIGDSLIRCRLGTVIRSLVQSQDH
jgi:hypothetical protein